MADSYSALWSTLGYGALSYFWGIPADEVDRLAPADKRRLSALTNLIVQMADAERSPIVKRLEALPEESLVPALRQLAAELLP